MELCFASQTPLSQDDELALMAGYAAAMDASMSEGNSTQDVTMAIASGTSSPPEESEPQEGPSGIGRPPEDWESQAAEDLDHTSLSMCVSEANCKKSRGERSPIGLADNLKPQVTAGGMALVFAGRLFHKTYFKSTRNTWPYRHNLTGLHLAVVVAICSSVMQSVFVFFSLLPSCCFNLSFSTIITAILEESSAKHTLCPDE